MHALIVLAHPGPRSFNAQMKDVALETLGGAGWTTEVSDLYAMRFDSLEGPRHYTDMKEPEWFSAQTEQRHAHDTGTTSADVRAEIAKLERADFVLLQFPVWWFSVPAMLKGWFDRVLVYGGVYTSTIRYDRGHFAGRRAMLSVSTGGPAPTLAYNGRNGDIDLQLWPANMSLAYVGYTVLPHYVAAGVEGGIKYSDADAHAHRIAGYKDELRQRLLALDATEPLRFNGWDDFDEEGRLKPGVAGHSYFMRAAFRSAPAT